MITSEITVHHVPVKGLPQIRIALNQFEYLKIEEQVIKLQGWMAQQYFTPALADVIELFRGGCGAIGGNSCLELSLLLWKRSRFLNQRQRLLSQLDDTLGILCQETRGMANKHGTQNDKGSLHFISSPELKQLSLPAQGSVAL